MTHIVLNRRRFVASASAFGATSFLSLPQAQAADTIKVGIAYVTPVGEIGWTKAHSLAASAIEAALPSKATVTAIENVFDPQDAERVFRKLAGSGHDLVIGTSFSHGTPMQKVAPQFPKVAFEHCSGIKHLPNLGIFEAKYFEGYYVAGVAAGLASKSSKLGFIGGFAIPDMIGMANALLLGARSVNPNASCITIFLDSWYDPAKEKQAANTLLAQGCDVVCSVTGTAAGSQAADARGAWSIGYATDMAKFAPNKQLTSVLFDWSGPYIQAAKDVMAGQWKARDRWLGLADGVVKLGPFNPSLPAGVVEAASKAESGIKAGAIHPFAGEIKDQAGAVRVSKGSSLADADIRSLNWFVNGMSGSLKS